jgi:hypothetical protein
MRRISLLVSLAVLLATAPSALAHNLYRYPKAGVTGDKYVFTGTQWQPGAYVYWYYYSKPNRAYVQSGKIRANSSGWLRLNFRDYNFGKHKMCFRQYDTRYPARTSGVAPGRLYAKCKTYMVWGTD